MSDVGVIFGGPSPEHDVSVLTGLQAARELQQRGRSVRGLFWSKAGDWHEVDPGLEASSFIEGVPRGSTPIRLSLGPEPGFVGEGGRFGRSRAPYELDAAVVCCHGGPGEDGTLQAALDLAGVRYTGPTVAGAALGMDKLAFGGVVAAAGLPCLPRIGLEPTLEHPVFDGPYIVKPRFGGSSIGIEVVDDLATAQALLRSSVHLRGGAVLEPYRPDFFDLQLAVRSWPSLALSAVERPLRGARAGAPAGSGILDYADKYAGGEGMVSAPRELPAQLSEGMHRRLIEIAVEVAQLSAVRGVARIDFLSDGSDLVVNEINTIPGSLARYLWIDPVVPFGTLLEDLLTEARERPTHAYSAAGADGTVLRGAGSIAAKLA